jgi:hypothetical protein
MVVDLIILVAAFVATVLAVVFELRREAKAAAKKKEQEELKRVAHKYKVDFEAYGANYARTTRHFASSYGLAASRPGFPYKKQDNVVKHYSEDEPLISPVFVPLFTTADPDPGITQSGFEGFGGGDSGGAGATSSWDAPSTPDTSSCVADSSPSTDFSTSCDTSSSFDSGSSGGFGGDF